MQIVSDAATHATGLWYTGERYSFTTGPLNAQKGDEIQITFERGRVVARFYRDGRCKSVRRTGPVKIAGKVKWSWRP